MIDHDGALVNYVRQYQNRAQNEVYRVNNNI